MIIWPAKSGVTLLCGMEIEVQDTVAGVESSTEQADPSERMVSAVRHTNRLIGEHTKSTLPANGSNRPGTRRIDAPGYPIEVTLENGFYALN